MSVNCKHTAEEADADADQDAYRDEALHDVPDRKEIHQVCQHLETARDIVDCLAVKEVNEHQRDQRTGKTDDHAFDDERRPYEVVRRADVFHDVDFFLPDRDTDGDGIADEEDGDAEQKQNDCNVDVRNQTVEAGERRRRKFRPVDGPDLIESLEIIDEISCLETSFR